MNRIDSCQIARCLLGLLLAGLLVAGSLACGDGSPADTHDAMTAVATSRSHPSTSTITPASGATLIDATFVRIVDGDTIIVRIGGRDERVRLIGINTPELNKPDGPVECYATEASNQTQALIGVADGHIQLERDVSETDQYGRLLRYVWLVMPEGKQLLNEELVEGGYARAIAYRPDVKYQSALNRDQTDARNYGRGLWGVCG
jgi:micrococcal nuclease